MSDFREFRCSQTLQRVNGQYQVVYNQKVNPKAGQVETIDMEGVYQPNLAHTTLYGEAPYFLFLVYYHMPHELKDSEEFDLDFRHCEPTDKKESSLILTHHKTGWKTEVLARNRAEVRAIMNEFFSNFYNNNND